MRLFVLPTLAGLVAAVAITLAVPRLFDTRTDVFGGVGLIADAVAAASGLLGGLAVGLTTWVLLRRGRKGGPK